MVGKFIKPIGLVAGGILCIHLSTFASSIDINKTSEKILAIVNGENITREDVNKVLSRFGNQINEEQKPLITKQVLEDLINHKLLMQFIKENKITVSDGDIDTEVEKVKEEIKSNPDLKDKTLDEVLAIHGSSIDGLKRDIYISLALGKYLEKDLNIDKMRNYFEKNRHNYDGSEVRVSHILVDTRNVRNGEELASAREKINKAKAELDAGKEFEEVARVYSDCPSAKEGGDLGFFKRKDQVVAPSLAAVAFALKVGEVSEPIGSAFGYHIIKVTSIKEGKNIRFDDVKDVIKSDMLVGRVEELIQQLKQEAKLVYINENAIAQNKTKKVELPEF